MNLINYSMNPMNSQQLFASLYRAQKEQEVEAILQSNPEFFRRENWHPLGGNSSNYSIVKNQQANPIAALVEKITNSIDAILTKKCIEAGHDPKSQAAPKSIQEAIKKFFKDEHANWDLSRPRKEQAKEIQIIADGERKNPSVIIYDNGEGQSPERFEKTFLSLISGNKKDIHFVQGKYNMGGSGSLVFCGKKRYQLIASKRFNGGSFGFTLVREHPLRADEQDTTKETWYEYLKIDNCIPSFLIDELELGLLDRKFKTGTIIKLYSYQFPHGYAGFAQDLNQSLNEYLFRPALPVYTVDKKERYPNNAVLNLDLFGLQRRLEESDYVEDNFSWDFDCEPFGRNKVIAYVFKSKLKDYDAKKSREVIRSRFFKNNMAVIFSLNGQVHGHYTSEFITRSLKLNLLKSHLLIHVDCTEMNYNFQKELFMASRDRLKSGEETKLLREFLARELSKKDGPLADIEKRRKDSITTDSKDGEELIRASIKNLPLDNELMKLLAQTYKLNLSSDRASTAEHGQKKQRKSQTEEAFIPNRFPTYLNLKVAENGGIKAISIPKGMGKTLLFDTDVENHYFDRIDESGEMILALVNYTPNDSIGGTGIGEPKGIEQLFNISKSSPREGKIRISLNPTNELTVGDEAEIKVTLSSPNGDLEELFWAKITQPEGNPKKSKKSVENEPLGLPKLELVYEHDNEDGNRMTWAKMQEQTVEFGYKTVMHPYSAGDGELETIYVNMGSNVFKSFLSNTKNPNEQQIKIAENKYISSVYFHTLFLYTITRNKGYRLSRSQDHDSEPESIEIGQYLTDIFDNFYSTFILNYGGMEEMMINLGD